MPSEPAQKEPETLDAISRPFLLDGHEAKNLRIVELTARLNNYLGKVPTRTAGDLLPLIAQATKALKDNRSHERARDGYLFLLEGMARKPTVRNRILGQRLWLAKAGREGANEAKRFIEEKGMNKPEMFGRRDEVAGAHEEIRKMAEYFTRLRTERGMNAHGVRFVHALGGLERRLSAERGEIEKRLSRPEFAYELPGINKPKRARRK